MAEPEPSPAAPKPFTPGGRTRSTWTHEQAVAMAARSAQLRAERAQAKRDADAKAAARAGILQPLTAAQSATERQLRLVSEQIEVTRALLIPHPKHSEDCPTCRRPFGLDGRDRAALIKALDILLDRERVLLNIPLPGSLKHGATRGKPAPRPGSLDGFRVLDVQQEEPAPPLALPPGLGPIQ